MGGDVGEGFYGVGGDDEVGGGGGGGGEGEWGEYVAVIFWGGFFWSVKRLLSIWKVFDGVFLWE